MKASLDIVKKWEQLFNQNNIEILNTYAESGVLIATFATKIKKGKIAIKPYFVNLFKKQNLRVKFDDAVFVNEFEGGYIVSGFYRFSYEDMEETKIIKARYSYAVQSINGKNLIINHHSSEVPND
jgi:hypothetical protein